VKFVLESWSMAEWKTPEVGRRVESDFEEREWTQWERIE
jgi:hypothetical protein